MLFFLDIVFLLRQSYFLGEFWRDGKLRRESLYTRMFRLGLTAESESFLLFEGTHYSDWRNPSSCADDFDLRA